MKTYILSSDSSSDDESLVIVKKRLVQREVNDIEKDPNAYTSLLEKDWQQCEFCDEVFTNRFSLIRHNVSHIIIPLIKQTPHQCKVCYHHFETADDLNSHISKYHFKNANTKAKILQSIVKNEAVIKCVDDLKELLVTHKEFKSKIALANENNVKTRNEGSLKTNAFVDENAKTNYNISNNAHTSRSDNAFDVLERNTEYCNERNVKQNGVDNSRTSRNNLENKVRTSRNNVENNARTSRINDENNARTSRSDNEFDVGNKVKEELSSPTKLEWSNSATDDEKESIRHRLIFEEDIEDTLFRDLSAECQVNIETLCKEVSLDFDDALFDDDDTVKLESENGTNKFGNGSNDSGKGINNFGNGINNYSKGINNIDNDASFNYEMESFNGINSKMVLNACAKEENENLNFREKSIHYDTLIVPDISLCRFCGLKFPNRFELLKHEPNHLKAKKQNWRFPLCCFCDKYIAGNYHSLRQHRHKEHPDKAQINIQFTTHTCPMCKLKYYNYQKHLNNYHNIDSCGKCGRGFETHRRNEHMCGKVLLGTKNRLEELSKVSLMHLCDLCFSFMKIYMQNRQNYEEVGTKSELGMRQTCDKCNNAFFTVKVVRRKALVRAMDDGKKLLDVGRKVKPLTNMERLVKIQNRLKMMKKINK